MTREQFLNGVSFKLPNQLLRGANTYILDEETILQEVRLQDGTLLFREHEANIGKIGRLGFEAYTFVLDKKVNIKFKFEELEAYEENIGE